MEPSLGLFEYFFVMIFVTYAWLRWIMNTSLMDHVSAAISMGQYISFVELKEKLSQTGPGSLIVDLFECVWCLSFHIALWMNIIFQLILGFNPFDPLLFINTFVTAGGAMFLYSRSNN